MSKEQIERYAFKTPLLFEGDRGSGKTYDIREYARLQKHPYLEIAGNESMESFDFLGHVMQSEKGLVWKDGKLSQAFRLAKDGKKVVLLIDEMLRIPQRHLSVLLSALSADSEGNFRLQTGRMTDVVGGIGVEEEIVVPMENIAIFATTNVGPEFAIDDLDPAVAERFIILRKDTQVSQLTKILEKKVELRSFNKLIALKLAEFYNKTTRMVKSGTLNRHATTRTLSRAIDIATDEQDVAQVLRDQILLWADRDSAGYPVTAQVEMLEKTIKELFSDLPKKTKTVVPTEAEKTAAKKKTAARKSAPKKSVVDEEEYYAEEDVEDFRTSLSKILGAISSGEELELLELLEPGDRHSAMLTMMKGTVTTPKKKTTSSSSTKSRAKKPVAPAGYVPTLAEPAKAVRKMKVSAAMSTSIANLQASLAEAQRTAKPLTPGLGAVQNATVRTMLFNAVESIGMADFTKSEERLAFVTNALTSGSVSASQFKEFQSVYLAAQLLTGEGIALQDKATIIADEKKAIRAAKKTASAS